LRGNIRIMNFPHSKIKAFGLTFDDVLLIPAHSQVLPRETQLKTRLSRNLSINIPFISAAMDTVTESQMAIAIAREGGIGFLHKNMTIERQAEEVRKVKRADSGLILDPITLNPANTVRDALKLMEDNKIGGIPVIDNARKLVGIVTNRDMRFETKSDKPISEVMTKENLIIAKEGTDLAQAEEILKQYKIEKLLVCSEDNTLKGLITYKDILKVKAHPNSSKDKFGRLLVGAALGVNATLFERIDALMAVGVDVVCLDTAHGHSEGVLKSIREIKAKYPNLELIAGNVATKEGAQALIDAGVDGVKVGVGPGSICTTRIIAGVGVPQLSAIMLAGEACSAAGIPMIADGGIRYTGDVAKAIAAGADCVMAGSIFAGVEEAPGDTVLFEGRKFKTYRGMGSIDAMAEGSKDRYFQDAEDDIKKLVPEGIVGRVPYKGHLKEVVYQFVGGLKASMGYCGAASIDVMKQASFIQITPASVKESHPHDVVITRESPNYSR
jgi:IMP dehydrogenase